MPDLSRLYSDPTLQSLRAECAAVTTGTAVSDVVEYRDGRTLQYVDLVMEGGGMLGIALLGYVHALESAGIRFLSVGGASAGSILSLLLAACADRGEEKTPGLVDAVFGMNLASFVDGDDDARDVSLLLARADVGRLEAVWKGLQVIDNITGDIGLNPGDAFCDWLDRLLRGYGTPTLADLETRLQRNPANLSLRGTGESLAGIRSELGIVAADLSTETKAVFPAMAPLYWADPQRVSPALFVRASMSIPFFFLPFRVHGVSKIPDVAARWSHIASYEGEIPDTTVFADGGLMSNFPISLFHAPGVPVAPTFGVKLGARGRRVHESISPLSYGANLFNAMRHYADFDFIARNPDYKHLLGYIDTRGHNWLNFFMGEEEKWTLFRKGMTAGLSFLRSFKWEEYKQVRADLEARKSEGRES
ncbi:MAG: patatin-like phospholipase family protein [Ignavibacteriae bacterium]|nr:patatin-like phospholipase family protein [Ignavibacteriota bacterium]